MMNLYIWKDNALTLKSEQSNLTNIDGQVLWIDLFNLTPAEESLVEQYLGIDIPTREEMHEIEISNRLYHESGAVYMTSIIVTSNSDKFIKESHAVTFIICKDIFVTVRYSEIKAFQAMNYNIAKDPQRYSAAQNIFVGLVDCLVDRVADKLENTRKELDNCATEIFARKKNQIRQKTDYQKIFENIGENGILISKLRESLITIERMIGYALQSRHSDLEEYQKHNLNVLVHDVEALSDYATFLSTEISFLLDATVGVVGIEQNDIIKIFSVVTVVFLPPTLIASMYGMNFHDIPELSFKYGYPFALLLMIVSAWLPYRYFKKKKWL